ncbi:hypothetical protein K525DRAFT_247126 [Schizophyllum commune Loenen D]|nr:hypothetical protein K525DRAFT_247126 [Schizophyllum commune Loenen D]
MNGVFGFDIQYTICTAGNLDRRDFCRLALTSRSWREAATPNIWVQPDAITPLLRLMPQDAWYMARNRPNDLKAYFWAEAIKKWDGMTSISLDPCFPEILLSIAPENLGLRGLSFFEMTSAIRSWDMRQLVSVDLGSPDRPLSSDELQYVTDSIRDYCTNRALYRVAIFYNAASLGVLEFPLTKEHLLPLAGFTHLKYLCLQVSLSVFLTDAEYAELLPCWPHLEHFEVNGGLLNVDEWDEESPATLVALQHFARYCPKLEELYLPLTVDEVPESDVETFGNDHPLWKLHLGCSAISAPADATATFLSFLFSNLTSAAFDWYTNKWHEVFRLVTAYCYGG